jgi:hypothetical protein
MVCKQQRQAHEKLRSGTDKQRARCTWHQRTSSAPSTSSKRPNRESGVRWARGTYPRPIFVRAVARSHLRAFHPLFDGLFRSRRHGGAGSNVLPCCLTKGVGLETFRRSPACRTRGPLNSPLLEARVTRVLTRADRESRRHRSARSEGEDECRCGQWKMVHTVDQFATRLGGVTHASCS